MVDKNEFKDATNAKQKLVAGDDQICESEVVGNDESSVLPSDSDKQLATTNELPSASNDEDQLREDCLRDLIAPLKKFTVRATAHLMEHSEEVNIATAVGLASPVLFITLITLCVVIVKEGSNFLLALKDIWWILAGIIPLYGMCLGAISLVGRELWLHGCHRSATSCFYFGSTPAKFLPHGFLNSHLAMRSLCALYLAQGLPLKAQSVLTQFNNVILTPEGSALSDALEAEAAAKAGQAKLAIDYARRAVDGCEHIGVEAYLKARLGRELFNHVGNCYFALGEFEKARESYLQALQDTVKADQTDHVAMIIAIINLARASTASGHNEQAQKWLEILSDDNALSFKVPIALKGELLLARAESKLAVADEETKNEGISLLKLADEEFRKSNVYPDTGNAARQLGQLSAEREENAEAEAYFRRALKVKTRALPDDHPSIVETRQELVDLLRKSGKTEAAAVEISLFAESHADQETNAQTGSHAIEEKQPSASSGAIDNRNNDPLAIGKRVRAQGDRRSNLILGGMTLYFVWQLVTSGIRAADPFCWAMLALSMSFTALLVGRRLNSKKKQEALKQLSTQQQSIECTVSFKRNTRPDNIGLAILAVLGEPFNREIVVKNEFQLVSSNLSYYARPQNLSVFMVGESPVSIKVPDGFVQLSPEKSLNEVHKQQSDSLGYSLVIAMVVSATLLSLLIWACSNVDREKVPTGLTAFEYYRSGAHEIQNDWSGRPRFYDLEKVKKTLDRAIEQDKNGTIGKLASSCENAELPRTIPSREILSLYEDGVFERTQAAEAEKCLRSCIEKAPDFDWAYCSLAEKLISQGKLQEAGRLLESANKLRPDSNMYLLSRAKLCLKTGDYKEAKVFIKKAIDNDPFLLSTYQALIGATLGI